MNKTKIIPSVSNIEHTDCFFKLNAKTVINVSDKSILGKGELLRTYLSPATGFSLPVIVGEKGDIEIELLKNPTTNNNQLNEEYNIEINEKHCKLTSLTQEGLARAIQTFRQLLPNQIFSTDIIPSADWEIGGCKIIDKPRFPWRGMHLDVCRHFISKEDVCKFIDLIALYKYNRFHFHLTEDQGWRIEIKKYPKLTEIGSVRESTLIGHLNDKPKRYDDTEHRGFYTQEDIKEIVAFAKQREIIIVPEIDMPGHMQAAISAYPELGCTDMTLKPLCHWGICQHILNVEESTITFVKDVIDEVLELFPGDYIHIGGDEAVKYEWEEQRKIQDRMLELGLKSEDELQSWFLSEIADHIQQKGRKVIGWDEILEGGVSEDISVMSWRNEAEGIKAAALGHNVVMTPQSHVYFDHYQGLESEEPLAIGGFTPLEKVYSFDPIPEFLPYKDRKYIMGSQGQLWTEYMKDFKAVEYMAFPRVCALSEVLWMDKNSKDYKQFLNKMNHHKLKLKYLGVNFRKW